MRPIVLVGYYGHGNAGDELLKTKAIEILNKSFAGFPIVSGSKLKTFYTIPFSSSLVFGGGSLLQNSTSSRSLLYYLSLIVWAKLFRKNVLLLAQGIGPISGVFWNTLTNRILGLCDHLSVRDVMSFERAKGCHQSPQLTVDLAFYKLETGLSRYDKSGKVGVNFRPCPAWSLNRKRLLAWVSDQHDIEPIVAQPGTDWGEGSSSINLQTLFSDPESSSYSAIVAMRYHVCLWAVCHGVPCLALVYDEKVMQFAKQFSLPYVDLRHPQNVMQSIEFEGYSIDTRSIELILNEINLNQFTRLVTLNPQMVVYGWDNPEAKEWLVSADYIIPDGHGITLGVKKRTGIHLDVQTGVALVNTILCTGQYSVYFLGGGPEIQDGLRQSLQERYPNCQVSGVRHGYFNDEEWTDILREVTETRPDFIFVGMGYPKQEEVIQELSIHCARGCAVGVGGVFDILSGHKVLAPKWVRRIRLEWLFRGLSEPRRLLGWGYLVRYVMKLYV